MKKSKHIKSVIKTVLFLSIIASYLGSCTKNELQETKTDVTAPTVLSVTPVNNSTSVSTSTQTTISFSEEMDPVTITSASIVLKQGTIVIPGTVTYTGTTATFSPSAVLASNTVYTCTITTAAKDVSGNAVQTTYTWSFTTTALADETFPTVLSVTPVANATSVPVTIKPTITFSEAMNIATITNSNITLKQGSVVVQGVINYSGTTAIFTPSASLSGNSVYSVNITTGVKDVAGNSMTSNYTWNFTTASTVPAGKSFATDVVPVLNLCNACHTHSWTTSSNSSVFYTNLINGGYVKPATPTTSKIYTKLNGGHPSGSTVSTNQVNTILTWMTEGSKNN